MSCINFNELAWKAPEHDGKFGYLPTDPHYSDIMEWIKAGTELWRTKTNLPDGTVEIRSRVSFSDTQYDAVVTFNSTTNMVMWNFRPKGEYHV